MYDLYTVSEKEEIVGKRFKLIGDTIEELAKQLNVFTENKTKEIIVVSDGKQIFQCNMKGWAESSRFILFSKIRDEKKISLIAIKNEYSASATEYAQEAINRFKYFLKLSVERFAVEAYNFYDAKTGQYVAGIL